MFNSGLSRESQIRTLPIIDHIDHMLIPPIANQSQNMYTYFTYSFSVQTASNTGTCEVFHFFSIPTPLPALSFYQNTGDDG